MAEGKPILRVGKIKSTGRTTLKSVDGHLCRSTPTPNANPSLTKLNRTLVGDKSQPLEDAVHAVYRKFGIDPAALRKDATLANDLVMSISPEWFRPLDPDQAGTWDQNRLAAFRGEAVQFLKKSFGNRLVRVDLHLDESTPHIHAVVVPVLPKADKSGFRLSSKDMFSPKNLTSMQQRWEDAVTRHGVGKRLKGSKAKHSKVRDYYAAIESQEVHDRLAQIEVSDPPTKGLLEGRESFAARKEAWKKTEAKRLRDELRPFQAEAAKGRLYDVERLTAQSARADAVCVRARFYEQAQQFAETAEKLDLAKAEIARLRVLPVRDVAAAMGYDGPIKPKDNAIDLVMRVGGIDFQAATAWLHQNMGRDAMTAALSASAASQTPSAPVFTRADHVKRRTVEEQLGALDAATYRVTLMREGQGVNFGTSDKSLAKDLLTKAELVERIPVLSAWNARGWNVFVTPIDMTSRFILLDDLSPATLRELRQEGYTPAVVQETSPGSLQAILRAPRSQTPEAATNEFFKDMNRARGDDRIVGLEHPMRLAGFQNRKDKHRDEKGHYPFVRLREAVNVACKRTVEMVRSYADRVTRHATPKNTPETGWRPPTP